MKISSILLAFGAFALALYVTQARAEEQTRFYDANGRSIGTAVPLGNGSVRYYDERGRSLGTSTTTGNTTKLYDERGRPSGTFQFDCRMRRQGTGR
jgi:YD repeat-containing protein